MEKIRRDKGKTFKIVSAAVLAAFWLSFLAVFAFSVVEKRMFPLYYECEVYSAADEYGIDRALMLSVINVESGFDPKAVSAKGAVGLMQILPSTGRFIADRKGIEDYDLFDVGTNLDFGGYYLQYLSERFSGLRETAAAYNAGEGTVRKWLKNAEYSADGVTLDKIPYRETETYVKKICESLKRYKKLYGKLLDK